MITPRRPLNLESSDRPAQAPARPGSRAVPMPTRPDQVALPPQQEDRQRDQSECFARDVRHGSVGEQAIERIEHQNDRRRSRRLAHP